MITAFRLHLSWCTLALDMPSLRKKGVFESSMQGGMRIVEDKDLQAQIVWH